MKNLATCKPTEFVKQTNRIKKSAEKWLKDTDIINIRKNMPKLETIPADADTETRNKMFAENKKKSDAQARKNLSRMLDAMLGEHPDETLELLALLCFVEPENVDDYTIEEYVTAIADMLNNEAVIGFFTSLARLGLMNTSVV